MCNRHYLRQRKHGDPTVRLQGRPPTQDVLARFHSKYVVTDNGCWLWTAGTVTSGYAALDVDGKTRRAHLWYWEHLNGPRPVYRDGPLKGRKKPLDHYVCDTPRCVNPDHLRPASDRENVLRSKSLQSANAAKTLCKRGHQFDAIDSRGNRLCKTCVALRSRKHYLNKKKGTL